MVHRLALTQGEPAGIGPDVLIQSAQRACASQLIAIADPDLLRQRARLLNLPLTLREWHIDTPIEPHTPKALLVLPVAMPEAVVPGTLNASNAAAVVETLRLAGNGCLAESFDAVVTAPVQKSIISNAGISFQGHTEFFQQLAGAEKVVMMLANPGLRVALVTTHLPLRAVPDAITQTELTRSLRILHDDLVRHFGISNPRILIAGLNPHAGEDGLLGHEEQEIMQPVIDTFRSEGMQLIGPLPADTLFTPKYLNNADAVLAMYHDQGLPVLKSHGFGESVNITLGLPFIRTSVDHGTALDLAGTGDANPGSMNAAIDMAHTLAQSSTPH